MDSRKVERERERERERDLAKKNRGSGERMKYSIGVSQLGTRPERR